VLFVTADKRQADVAAAVGLAVSFVGWRRGVEQRLCRPRLLLLRDDARLPQRQQDQPDDHRRREELERVPREPFRQERVEIVALLCTVAHGEGCQPREAGALVFRRESQRIDVGAR
jgi:hypothetical protein